ncbi:PQQ-dependent sugar dehydrogenase [Stackebrandtia albiflava]
MAAVAAIAVGAGVAVLAQAEEAAPAGGFDFGAPEVVADGLELPWGMDFLPDGSALVTQRDTAQILRMAPGEPAEPVMVVSGVVPGGEGGLLGLAVSPAYDTDGLIYVYYTAESDNRVGTVTLDDHTPTPVLTGIPKANIHNGGRIEFGPDGMLYVTTGDAADRDASQDPENLGGKILRVEPDGAVPSDNPFPGSPVYSLGHRNVQGIAWTGDGRAYASELGQNTWDEVNHVVPGANYGWPVVEGPGGEPDFTPPLHTWTTAEASPSGAAIHGETLFVAALRGSRLWLVPLDGGEPYSVLDGSYGRLRTVEIGPDGWLWIATSNGGDDLVLRFPPTT